LPLNEVNSSGAEGRFCPSNPIADHKFCHHAKRSPKFSKPGTVSCQDFHFSTADRTDAGDDYVLPRANMTDRRIQGSGDFGPALLATLSGDCFDHTQNPNAIRRRTQGEPIALFQRVIGGTGIKEFSVTLGASFQ
jgi:hypothetical protein